MNTPRWYMLNKMGMATLCLSEKDAKKEAAEAQIAWPHMGPHRAVQLVEAADVEAMRAGYDAARREIESLRAALAPADSVLEDATRWTTEQEHAIRQGYEIAASDGYFEARAVLAKWGSPQSVVQEPLTDAQIAEMMRDTWGCASIAPRHALEFARAVEAEVREQDEALIQQLVEALEGYRRNHNDTQPCDAEREGRAWLEIESLRARSVDTSGEYPALPEQVGWRDSMVHYDFYWRPAIQAHNDLEPLFTADQMRAYVDADRAMRAAQPAQAQAVAVPLTDEQIRAMCKESWVFETVKQWVRITEQHHGITGGQHGTE